uniref:hydroxyacid-oxoacid transhydrogenase n=1 Tax=Phlebotomus papatasi TaxID=29031 RepID=A0A1B0D660_PHLPP
MVPRRRVLDLLQNISKVSCRCPSHSSEAGGGAKDNAFEMASSTIRYGPGVTRELGADLTNLGSKNICLLIDKNLVDKPSVRTAFDSLTKYKITYEVFQDVRVEPTDQSLQRAIDYARKRNFDAYVAIGGGSVIDTAKAANLYAVHPEAEFLDFVNSPIGKSKEATNPLKPLIAVPTTAGTGSEATAACVFDYKPLHVKTGISNKALRPMLGLIDPLHTLSLPERVMAYAGFDVFCHALESFTAVPYNERGQQSSILTTFPASIFTSNVADVGPEESCSFQVFFWTSARCILERASRLAEVLQKYMYDLKIEDGLTALGFSKDDIPALVKGTLPQERILKMAPREQTEEDLSMLFEHSMKVY